MIHGQRENVHATNKLSPHFCLHESTRAILSTSQSENCADQDSRDASKRVFQTSRFLLQFDKQLSALARENGGSQCSFFNKKYSVEKCTVLSNLKTIMEEEKFERKEGKVPTCSICYLSFVVRSF